MKVLIIEDEPALRATIQQYLAHQSFICEIAADFHQAMDKVNEFDYDCIVADIGLPMGNADLLYIRPCSLQPYDLYL